MKKRRNMAKSQRIAVGFSVSVWYMVLLLMVLISAYSIEIHAENGYGQSIFQRI